MLLLCLGDDAGSLRDASLALPLMSHQPVSGTAVAPLAGFLSDAMSASARDGIESFAHGVGTIRNMTITTNPEWQQMALYALAGAVLLFLIFRIPRVGAVIRGLVSIALLALCLFILFQQAPFDPTLGRMSHYLGLDGQEVVGDEIRIPMARDGHFWAEVEINGTARRMLVDSGATVTAISEATANEAGIERDAKLVPVILQTANGTVRVETGTIEKLAVGAIEARNLKVVISPAIGNIDVLGMNFLSQLASWRVEGRTLILVPPAASGPASAKD